MEEQNNIKTAILFGTGVNAVNMARLSVAVGVSKGTISRWKKEPDSIPLWAVSRICRLRGVPENQYKEVLRDAKK